MHFFLSQVCKDFEAANVTCFDWFPGPDRPLQFAAGLNKGQVTSPSHMI